MTANLIINLLCSGILILLFVIFLIVTIYKHELKKERARRLYVEEKYNTACVQSADLKKGLENIIEKMENSGKA